MSVFLLFVQFIYGQKHMNDKNQLLRIPVVFHVIHDTLDEKSLDDCFFQNIIDRLNESFNDGDVSLIDGAYKKDVAKCNVQFYIPSHNKSCKKIDPITWHKTYLKEFSTTSLSELLLKLRFGVQMDSKKYLNIWICNLIDRSGYAKFPDNLFEQFDSVVLDIDYFLAKKRELPNLVLAHEIGHYFNLLHIWGEGSEHVDSCSNTDLVSDTPSQIRATIDLNKNNIIDENEKAVTCNNESIIGNYQNFMDYSMEGGMFTNGQKERMRNTILSSRKGLIWSNNCNVNYDFCEDEPDDKVKKWIQIGNQKWMSENMNYKTPNSKCYDNKETNCTVYGRLYNWEDAINVCPTGWRLPSKDDWKKLTTTVNNNQNSIRSEQGWLNNKNGTNSSGLNFLPSGYKFYYTNFSGLGKFAKIWLSNSSGNSAYSRDIGERGYDELPQAGIDFKRDYLSCRCIEDKSSTSNIDSPLPTINNNNNIQESSPAVTDDFFIGEWIGDVSTYIFRKDKKYIIKSNNSDGYLPPTPYVIWSYSGENMTLKQQNTSPFVYRVEIISQTRIALYDNVGLFGIFNRVKSKQKSETINKNIKYLNNKFKNQPGRSAQPKKKGVNLRTLKKQN